MANLARVRSTWAGPGVVGPGVSTFYVDEADTGFVADLGTFWTTVRSLIPSGTVITTLGSGDLIDIATGELTGSWSDGGSSVVTCNGAGDFAGGVGCRIAWATSGIRNGRRVRGSTFVVPLLTSQYTAGGILEGTTVTTVEGAASALRTAMGTNLKVYSRPAGGVAGQASTVISSSVPNAISWLRTRRV